jgi:hypothetical protein
VIDKPELKVPTSKFNKVPAKLLASKILID